MLVDAAVDRVVYPGPPAPASCASSPAWLRRLQQSKQPCCFAACNTAGPSERLYVFMHGNADCLVSWQQAGLLQRFSEALGADCMLLSYPGYPLCAPARAQGAARDAEAVSKLVLALREAQSRYPNVWLAGHSIGCAMALACCAHVRVSGLLLMSPFDSLRSMAAREYGSVGAWAVGRRFDNVAAARAVRCPVIVLHGSHDAVVPEQHSLRLFKALPANALKHRYIVPGMGHALAPMYVPDVAMRVRQHFPALAARARRPPLQFY